MELVRAVVIGAAGNIYRQAVGLVVGPDHQVLIPDGKRQLEANVKESGRQQSHVELLYFRKEMRKPPPSAIAGNNSCNSIHISLSSAIAIARSSA